MTEEDVKMFLDDLDDNDWVFMVDGNGNLKSLLIPDFYDNDKISDNIFKILALLDPKIVKELQLLIQEEQEDLENLDDSDLKPGETLH